MTLIDEIKAQPGLLEALVRFKAMLGRVTPIDKFALPSSPSSASSSALLPSISDSIKIPRSHKASVHDIKHHRIPFHIPYNILFVPNIQGRTDYSIIIMGKILGMGATGVVFEAEMYPPLESNAPLVLKMLITQFDRQYINSGQSVRYTTKRIQHAREGHTIVPVNSRMVDHEYLVLQQFGKGVAHFSRSKTKLMWFHNQFEMVEIHKEFILEVREPGVDLLDFLQTDVESLQSNKTSNQPDRSNESDESNESNQPNTESITYFQSMSFKERLKLSKAILKSVLKWHEKNWIHTDIKLDNMMLKVIKVDDRQNEIFVNIDTNKGRDNHPAVDGTKDRASITSNTKPREDDYEVTLIDYSSGIPVDKNKSKQENLFTASTREYKAPEILIEPYRSTGYSLKSDMYAVGECLNRILNIDIPFAQEEATKQFINSLINPDPIQRPNINQAMRTIESLLETPRLCLFRFGKTLSILNQNEDKDKPKPKGLQLLL